MFARVTLLEIDTERVTVADALQTYESEVLPEVRRQSGYAGVYVLSTPEGKGLVMTLWSTEEQASADGRAGFYEDVLARFVTVFRAPPGRERYEVALAEAPVPVS